MVVGLTNLRVVPFVCFCTCVAALVQFADESTNQYVCMSVLLQLAELRRNVATTWHEYAARRVEPQPGLALRPLP